MTSPLSIEAPKGNNSSLYQLVLSGLRANRFEIRLRRTDPPTESIVLTTMTGYWIVLLLVRAFLRDTPHSRLQELVASTGAVQTAVHRLRRDLSAACASHIVANEHGFYRLNCIESVFVDKNFPAVRNWLPSPLVDEILSLLGDFSTA